MKEKELRDWEHFREYVSDEFGGKYGYIFRGHADRNWKLESTLTRLAQRVSGDSPPKSLETAQLKNFRMRIRGLRGHWASTTDYVPHYLTGLSLSILLHTLHLKNLIHVIVTGEQYML